MADPMHVAVVGGGITGLAAAHAVLARGEELGRAVRVTVLERSPRFGGNLVTERADGYLLDGGPDSWVITKPQATALARSLGLGDALVGTNQKNRRFYIAWEGHLHPVPEGLVLGVPTKLGPLAASHLFSWGGKARMALEPFVRPRRFEGDDDESIADFATRRLGREAAQRLVAPLLGGISAGDATDISVRAAFPQLVTMESEHGSLVRGMRSAMRARAQAQSQTGGKGTAGSAFVSLTGGVGQLVDVLADRLRASGVTLRARTAVEALSRRGEGWTVGLAGGESLDADAVLLAAPAYVVARLVAPLDGDASRALSGIAYGSTATVFLGYRREDLRHPLDGVGFVVPRAAERPILAGTWVSSKWDGRAPDGRVLLRCFLGGASGEGVLSGSDEDLVRVSRDELRALMGIEAQPDLTRVFRFERASAQMRVGHLATMRSLHERLAHVAPRLRVAGGGYDGVGIPDCIRQGQDAAKLLVGP
jgi:oxygen-dependent protoporphyrinogen oxidase